MELAVGVQNYAWGKLGSESEVARLYKQQDPSIQINADEPYAELWMGTHENCPSRIKSTQIDLSCFLKNYPHYLGDKSIKHFGSKLPFLFKVLSIQKALSIQAHPNIHLAQKLHAQRPDLYKDANHKPELAIALTDFKAMCGFRPYEEIQSNFKGVPELKHVIGSDIYDAFLNIKDSGTASTALPKAFRNLMTSSSESIADALTSYTTRIKKHEKVSKEVHEINQLVLKLSDQFPNDVGCFGPLFFNVFTLKPGEAIYLGPNEPHAYIEGDCVECMASSDNVVRAGLTPKFKDVETLCEMLNYTGASGRLFKADVENEFTSVFRPPVPDFAVAVIKVPKGTDMDFIARDVASIVIFIKGYAHTHEDVVCAAGTVLFLPAKERLQLVDVKEDVVCYQGMANL